MNLEYLEGTWKGFYTYGPEYSVQYQTMKVEFVFELTSKGGIIMGTCVDSFTKEFFEQPAIVEGVLIDKDISLIKKYPCFLGIDENDKTFIDWSAPSAEIHYSGLLRRKMLSNEYFVVGTWDISGSFRDEQGDARYYTNDGDFEMYKVK